MTGAYVAPVLKTQHDCLDEKTGSPRAFYKIMIRETCAPVRYAADDKFLPEAAAIGRFP